MIDGHDGHTAQTSFESDPETLERIKNRGTEVFLDDDARSEQWASIEHALEKRPDLDICLGERFGVSMGTNYALRCGEKKLRLLICSLDLGDAYHRGIMCPDKSWLEKENGGLAPQRPNNWTAVQNVAWTFLSKGGERPTDRPPFYVTVDGKQVPWLSCCAYTNVYQRALVYNGTNKSHSSKGRGDPDIDHLYRELNRRLFLDIFTALDPTHVIFQVKAGAEIIKKEYGEKYIDFGEYRFRVNTPSGSIEGAWFRHPTYPRDCWSSWNRPYFQKVVRPIIGTLLDGNLPPIN